MFVTYIIGWDNTGHCREFHLTPYGVLTESGFAFKCSESLWFVPGTM
jgi:hypothetical protein